MELLEDIAAQAVELASRGGVGLLGLAAIILALAVVLVLARRAPRPTAPPDPVPERPDAVWGDNVSGIGDEPGGPGGGG